MKRRNYGFVLLEIFAAIALLGGAMLIAGQWWQAEAQRKLRLQWIADAQQIAASLALFWLSEQRPPASLTELITTGYLQPVSEPWRRSWQLETGNELSYVTLQAPDATRAAWLGGQLPQAFTAGNQVRMAVWRPFSLDASDDYLHRVAIAGSPELNQLETGLDINGHDLLNGNYVQADHMLTYNVQSQVATVQSAAVQTLNSTEISATYVTTRETSMAQLQNQLQELQDLWQQCQAQGGCQ